MSQHPHHTGVFTAHGDHRHHDDHQHIANIFGRAVKEAHEAGYEFSHAGVTSGETHHNPLHGSGSK